MNWDKGSTSGGLLRKRAYTFTELIVALGLTAIIIAAAVLALSGSIRTRSLEESNEKLLARERVLVSTMATDLDRAIRLTGASADLLPGIFNPKDTAPDPEEVIDEMSLHIEMFGEASVPVQSWDLANSKFEALIDESRYPESPILLDFARNKPLVYLKNLRRSNLLLKDADPTFDPETRMMSYSFKSSLEDGFDYNDYEQ